MSDADIAAVQEKPTSKRDRSPNFPAIGLGRAVERIQQLYNRARRYDARLTDAAAAWGFGVKSSSTLQTAAALLAFGLAEDSGSGDARKIRVSDLGWRILEDQRPGAREKALSEAALKPKLIADYAEHWRTGRPDDNFCISELKIERGFTEDAAVRFLKVFDETIQFATPTRPDMLADRQTGSASPAEQQKPPQTDETPPPPAVKVGDYVQWTSGGVDQLKHPRRVRELDGNYALLHGELTGVPVSELTVVEAPAPPPVGKLAAAVNKNLARFDTDGMKDINILLLGAGRLQITAEVDRAGLATLRQMLDKYEEILDLLGGVSNQEAVDPPAEEG